MKIISKRMIDCIGCIGCACSQAFSASVFWNTCYSLVTDGSVIDNDAMRDVHSCIVPIRRGDCQEYWGGNFEHAKV